MGKPVIHPSAAVGPRVVVAADAVIGPNCVLDGETRIGARARLVAGVMLFGDAVVGEDCVIEPGVSMTTLVDRKAVGPLVLGAGVRVGAGSVLALGVTVGANARIDARTIVSRTVPAGAIVSGNPGAVVGSAAPIAIGPGSNARKDGSVGRDCAVAGVRTFELSRVQDLRSDPRARSVRQGFPFDPKCYFLAEGAPSSEAWGEHAHRSCEHVLICVSGSVTVIVDDGRARDEIRLDSPTTGLYLPPRVWVAQQAYSQGAALLVFASHVYDPLDYIRSYAQFIAECRPAA